VIIECPTCEAKVDGKILADHESYIDEIGEQFKVSFMECPVCKNEILASQQLEIINEKGDCEWDTPYRCWPKPNKYYDYNLPVVIRESLQEAEKCYSAGAYIACAVMCGRALEGICANNNTKNRNLASGFKELLEKEIIDKKIYEWAEMLRQLRNIGAHAGNKTIHKEDAKDQLDFTEAIINHIFTLTEKFRAFAKRRGIKNELIDALEKNKD